jgi:cysteinyl-tRNA synthetase
MLKLTNTLTGKKEVFEPLKPNEVSMYVCGITPYDYAHLGHARAYVSFDVLVRLFKYIGYTVVYCRNFTDIDDKILARAHKELGDIALYPEITKKFITAFHADVDALNCLHPTFEPRVTLMIDQIISFIERLIAKGHAYAVDGDVYFSVESWPAYGKLSKHKVEDLIAGQRIEPSDKKRSPLDFALWKGSDDHVFYKSPWGYGRPGWHIECSAMSEEYLGAHFDIHGGGRDLIFPHHENEIAQSESLHGAPMARFWLHNGFVRVNEEKMSKSLGNFFSLHDLFKEADPMVIRFYLLNHQYRAPLDFSQEELAAIEKSYKRLIRVFDQVLPHVDEMTMRASSLVQQMLPFLYDDLNTVGLMGLLFESLDALQKDQHELAAVKGFLQQVLGLTLAPLREDKVVITDEIRRLLAEREDARAAKDWARADLLRDQLQELGYAVQDKKV